MTICMKSNVAIGEIVKIEKETIEKGIIDYYSSLDNYLDIRYLDNEYRLKILHIRYVLEKVRIVKYLEITKCAFVQVNGEAILSIDIRNEPEKSDTDTVNIIVAEILHNGSSMLMGFVVDKIEEFFQKLF